MKGVIHIRGRIPVIRNILILLVFTLVSHTLIAKDNKALALYRAGIELFKANEPDQALKLFVKSRHIKETPDVVWAIARCYEQQGRYTQAIATFQHFLQIAPDWHARRYAEKKIRELQGKQGHVHVECNTPGARIFVNGKPRGLLPLDLVLDPDTYDIRVEKANWEIFHKVLQIKTGESLRLDVVLKPVLTVPRKVVVQAVGPVKRPVSKLKAALLWGGMGLAVLGGGIQVWGYIQAKNAANSEHTHAQYESARNAARVKYYCAYAMYGAGAVAIVLSFVLPTKGRNPLITAVPLRDGAAIEGSIRW